MACPSSLFCRLGLLFILCICLFPSVVVSLPTITFYESSAITCSNVPTRLARDPSVTWQCLNCPSIPNISFTYPFTPVNVPCSRVSGSYDYQLGYSSISGSNYLSFYEVAEPTNLTSLAGNFTCDPAKLIANFSIPNPLTCSNQSPLVKSAVVTFYSQFDGNGVESLQPDYTGAILTPNCDPTQSANQVLSPNNFCPLENEVYQIQPGSTGTLCSSPQWRTNNNSTGGFTTTVTFNITLSNPCAAGCLGDLLSTCLSSESTCVAAINSASTLMANGGYNAASCSCYKASYNCRIASGCYTAPGLAAASLQSWSDFSVSFTNACGYIAAPPAASSTFSYPNCSCNCPAIPNCNCGSPSLSCPPPTCPLPSVASYNVTGSGVGGGILGVLIAVVVIFVGKWLYERATGQQLIVVSGNNAPENKSTGAAQALKTPHDSRRETEEQDEEDPEEQ